MAIRFRKSFKIAPGVRLSVGKKSGSIRIGPKNAGVSLGTSRKSVGASLPGTGLGVSSQSRGGCAGAAVMLLGTSVVAAGMTLGSILSPSPALAGDYWNGFYAGLSIGHGSAAYYFGDTGKNTMFDNLSGAVVGGQVGYMFNINHLVLGIEAAAFGGSISQTIANVPSPGNSISFNVDALGAVNLRAGVQIDRFLPYLTAGVLVGRGTGSSTAPGYTPDTEVHTGYDFGGGLDVALTDQVSMRAEYLVGHLNPRGYTASGVTQQAGINLQMIRVGADWHF